MKKIDSLFEFENYSVRDLYKKLWLNLLTTVLMSFIFVGATYAWFSSFAFTLGSFSLFLAYIFLHLIRIAVLVTFIPCCL